MAQPGYVMVSLVLLLATMTASLPLEHDIEHHFALAKRSHKKRDIGIGFAITISVVVFGVIAFYLGVRHGKTGSWYCWRDIEPNGAEENGPKENLDEHKRLKARISCPLPISASAPVELSPVEAPRRPTFLELSGEAREIYEMGQPSPRRPSWFDRRSWFRGDDSRRSRHGAASRKPTAPRDERERSLYEVSGESANPPAYSGPARPETVWAREEQRQSGGVGLMDWSGLEYVKKMYAARKSINRSV